MSTRSTVLFLSTVFFMFAPIGFLVDIWSGGTLPLMLLALNVIYSGLVAIGYAYSFSRNFKVLPPTILFQFGFHFIPWEAYFSAGPQSAAEVQARLTVDGVGIMIMIILAYILFINFITKEGIRHIELSKEMELAGEIHRVLVPVINRNDDRFEITGRSIPTDEVGGDLIDMIEMEDGIIIYMIDVSGHGVGPGLLSGMFKAAFRSTCSNHKTLKTILQEIHGILLSQRKKGMFITFGGIRFYDDDRIEILSAGHPPFVRIDSTGQVEELRFSQLPVLAFRSSEFKSRIFKANSGDLYVIYSDGIIETVDKKGKEFGFENLVRLLKESRTISTETISQKIFSELNRFGASHDDQSLLLIRKK
jgi:hypothetical protein